MAEDDLKVLVVGATGRVGRMLRRHWDAAPPDGIALGFQARQPGGDFQWDVEDGADALAAYGEVDRMLVLAGVTPAEGVDLERNAAIARACHTAAAQMGAAHMLLASSSAVYGAGHAHPGDEADTPAPTTPYGTAKLEAERAVLDGEGGPPACALRIGNVLGADALMLNAVKASEAQPLLLDRFVDGHGPVRSYIGPLTLAQALETLLHQGAALPGILNVGAPAPIAMQSILEAGDIPYVMRPAPPDAVQNITLDCSALARLHMFHNGAATAAHMLDEWQQVREPQ